MKTLLIIVGLALLLACVALLRWRRAEPNAASISQTSRSIGGPAFEVLVEQPLVEGRAPWEIPGIILGYSERGPRFDQASPGARIGNVTPDHVELSADGGWDLLIETDSEGRITPATRLAFPIKLGGRPLTFNCRPADRAVGYFRTTNTVADTLDGDFVIEVTICKNALSGKTAMWPYRPLTVRGSFAGLKKRG
jgi:hypothetical protein